MAWLAFDIGSSQWKAGLFDKKGQEIAIALSPIPLTIDSRGNRVVKAGHIIETLGLLMSQFSGQQLSNVDGIAGAGMAEGGLILNRSTKRPISDLLPWFDTRGKAVHEYLTATPYFNTRNTITGLPESPKYSVYKLLALMRELNIQQEDSLWCGAPEYIACLLTGTPVTDPSLAARTDVFDIEKASWDTVALKELGLSASIFPPVLPSGSISGTLSDDMAKYLQLKSGIPVAVCGHDHLVAASGAGTFEDDSLYCSAGTAQVLVKGKKEKHLSYEDLRSGLSFGPSPMGGLCVLGAIQAAGASLNMMKSIMYQNNGFKQLLHDSIERPNPAGNLLYFPYLMGSGPPMMNPNMKGAFIGLELSTQKTDMINAVYQGLAFESRIIVEAMGGTSTRMTLSGGLSAHPMYLKALANTLGVTVEVPLCQEGTLYGAARLMARQLAADFAPLSIKTQVNPDTADAASITTIYQKKYLPLRQALADYYR